MVATTRMDYAAGAGPTATTRRPHRPAPQCTAITSPAPAVYRHVYGTSSGDCALSGSLSEANASCGQADTVANASVQSDAPRSPSQAWQAQAHRPAPPVPESASHVRRSGFAGRGASYTRLRPEVQAPRMYVPTCSGGFYRCEESAKGSSTPGEWSQALMQSASTGVLDYGSCAAMGK
eukprot:CAMPEP_0174733194 /NCGR_PEP_ID=MMETSP1094-20130205/60830_1 /TAXON_ID=156173 /ORGANISM="Chrysochromulina brevifilum, Strain UTEX LB 985" /LENGTH=177 /DNA_ID=CAMNT_0015935817 /DNA_START=144 /DNA_END=674 /DNA_ORIENTATION=-